MLRLSFLTLAVLLTSACDKDFSSTANPNAPSKALAARSAPINDAQRDEVEAQLMEAAFGRDFDGRQAFSMINNTRMVIQSYDYATLADGQMVLAADAGTLTANGVRDERQEANGQLLLYWFRQENRKWKLVRKKENLGNYGWSGQLGQGQFFTSAAGQTLLLVSDSDLKHGYAHTTITLFQVNPDAVQKLTPQSIIVKSSNEDICEPETVTCWDIDGSFDYDKASSNAANSRDSQLPDISLHFSGNIATLNKAGKQAAAPTISEKGTVITQARNNVSVNANAVYRFSGGRYQLIQGKNLAEIE